MGSSLALWGGERWRVRDWGSVREDTESPLLLGSAEAVEGPDGEAISPLASGGSWEMGCSEEVPASKSWGVCRDGGLTGRDKGRGSGGVSSSACHLGLPDRSGRLKQLSGSPLWQQSKLWLGRRLLVLVALVLRLSRISLSKSSSSPEPRKLPSRASSAHGSWASPGLRGGVPSPRDSEGLSSSRSLLLGRRGRFCPKCWVMGSRCCRRSDRLVREGVLREPPLCRPESPSLYIRRLCTPFKPLFAFGGAKRELDLSMIWPRDLENSALQPCGQLCFVLLSAHMCLNNIFKFPVDHLRSQYTLCPFD